MLYRRGDTRQTAIRFVWRFFVPVQKYHVTREHGEWTIRFDNERIVATAVEAARLEANKGRQTEVLVLKDGVYQCKWRRARDLHPQVKSASRCSKL